MGGRVLRVVTRLNRGGPLRQLEALVPGLAALGWTGRVLAGRPAQGEEDGSEDLAAVGADVVRLPSLGRTLDPLSDARAFGEIRSWIRRARPDVVHTHMGKAGALGRLAARSLGVPAVHTFHGHHFTAPWPRGFLARAAERALSHATSAAIVLSDRQRHDIVETDRIVSPSKVHVVGPAIDVAAYCRRAADVPPLATSLRDSGLPLFLWAGRFVPVKDPLFLVEAVARSRRALRVAMVGDGPLRSRVLGAIRAAELEGVISCPGPAPHTAGWIAASDAVVLSSRSEGTPIAIVEAMVAGRAVVSTAVGGVPDLVEDGATGLLVPPGDTEALARGLDRMAEDAPFRRSCAERALRAASGDRFTPERIARETAAVYEILTSPGR